MRYMSVTDLSEASSHLFLEPDIRRSLQRCSSARPSEISHVMKRFRPLTSFQYWKFLKILNMKVRTHSYFTVQVSSSSVQKLCLEKTRHYPHI